MYEDKTLTCKECGAEFVFTAGESRNFMRLKALSMSRRDARPAVMPAKTLRSRNARCLLPYARIAVRKQKYLSGHAKIAPYIAASALQR